MGPTRLIYITGCDGTGKSTQANILTDFLMVKGVRAKRLWLRFPFIISIPLLVYARMAGLSWSEKVGGFRYGHWDFTRSWIMRCAFPWVYLMDIFLAGIWRVYLPMLFGQTIVCERFALDSLVDLVVASQDGGLLSRLPGRLFPKLVPRSAKVIVLDLEPDTIVERRPELANDQGLGVKLRAFRTIAAARGYPVISTSTSVDSVQSEIQRLIGCG